MNIFESDITNDIYDMLFKNDHGDILDFVSEFPGSEVDNTNARITLCAKDGTEFTVTVTKTFSPQPGIAILGDFDENGDAI